MANDKNFKVKNGVSVGTDVVLEGANFNTTLTKTAPTANRTITFPDASGTVVLGDGLTTYSVKASSTTGGANLDLDAAGPTNSTDSVKFAGAGISVVTQTDASTITITSTEADTLASVTGRGATTTSALSITNTTQSSSSATGSLVLSGGLGVAKNLYVGENIVVTGNLTVQGTQTSISTSTLTVSDKTIELGSVSTVTGITGTVTSTATTTTVTGLSTVTGLTPGQTVTRTAGTGNFGTNATIVTVDSSSQITVTASTNNTSGSITFTAGGPTDITANNGGIELKGDTDKTILWDNANDNWSSSEHWNLLTGKSFKINNTIVLSSTQVLGKGFTNASGEILTTDGTQTLSNKTLTLPKINDTSSNHTYDLAVSELAANRTITLPLLANDDTFVFQAHTQTLSNKTLTLPKINDTSSNHTYDLAVSELAANRTITLPLLANDDTFVFQAHTQTLSNKTLTLPKINDTSSDHTYDIAVSELAASRTITLPLLTGNDTFVFESHTQTLTNKTLTSPSISGLTLSDSSIVFEGTIADNFETTLTVTNPTEDRTITLPNATGTVALTSDIGAGTLSIGTKTAGATNTDVTLNLSGAYSANTSDNRTINSVVGPALTALATQMTGAGTGFLRKNGQDTFSLDTNTYLTAEADTLATVTGRASGNTTATAISLTNSTASTSTTTGALVVTGGVGVGGNLNIGGNLEVTGITTLQETTEVLNTKTSATGTVVHNLSEGNTWYHSSISANFTANFTNVPTTNNRTIVCTLILVQGATAYIPNAVQIDGVAQTINWTGHNGVPTGDANDTNIATFILIRQTNSWTVLGSVVNNPATSFVAGGGIGLSGSTFSVAAGTGLTQDTDGLSMTEITAGSSTVGAVRYNGTTKTSGQFDGGSTAPTNTTRLNYDGNFYATNFFGNGSNLTGISAGATITDDTSTNGTRYILFDDITSGSATTVSVSSTKLYFNPSTGDLSATNFNSLSDVRYKTDLAVIENALDKVKQLTGYTYSLIENGKRGSGLLAQDVNSVLPEAVGGTADKLELNYAATIGLIVEAIKELSDKIDELKRN